MIEIIKSRYDYLTSLGYEVVSIYLYGSQNYNLHYENSDIDCKQLYYQVLGILY